MASRIQALSRSVINKIAAGEVIERPASVVKELLENSLDALATRIEVDVAAGGTELIRISDDGEGIVPEDLPLAVASHATSKISSADDLFEVHTMGFRGEALASIAEVSRLHLRSRRHDAEEGAELTVDLGDHGPVRPCGCPPGTLIEVRQLFENTPVRRKFLKSTATEFGHISEQFTRIALAHPRVHFVLRHNGRTVYDLPPVMRLLDRLRVFFGTEVAEGLIAVESELGPVRMWGYVGHPSQSKATRKSQYLFLNGRWIQDRSLQHALTEAYRGLLMVGRMPICFLCLEVPSDLVDVNVHPTKIEVRFRDGQALFRQLLAMIRSKFLSLDLQTHLQLPGRDSDAGTTLDGEGGAGDATANVLGRPAPSTRPVMNLAPHTLRSTPARPPAAPLDWSTSGAATEGASARGDVPGVGATTAQERPSVAAEFAEWARHELATWTPDRPAQYLEPDDSSAAELPPSSDSAIAPESGRESVTESLPVASDATWTMAQAIATASQEFRSPSAGDSLGTQASSQAALAALETTRAMQVHDCYLVVETADGLTVIDQHALHERILYESFRQRVLTGNVESQRLLVPQPIEVPPRDASILCDAADVLGELGFGVEEFGQGTVLLTRYPVMLGRQDPGRILRDIAEQMVQEGTPPSRRDLLDRLLHMMACKAAVKAGQRLTTEEIDSLLAQRAHVDDAHHCPHGRPTALTLSRAELDRQFGRLG